MHSMFWRQWVQLHVVQASFSNLFLICFFFWCFEGIWKILYHQNSFYAVLVKKWNSSFERENFAELVFRISGDYFFNIILPPETLIPTSHTCPGKSIRKYWWGLPRGSMQRIMVKKKIFAGKSLRNIL